MSFLPSLFSNFLPLFFFGCVKKWNANHDGSSRFELHFCCLFPGQDEPMRVMKA